MELFKLVGKQVALTLVTCSLCCTMYSMIQGYTVDLVELIRSQNLQPHLYADDSQFSCWPGDTLTRADRVTRCVDLVASWMRANQLRLNSDKTEVIWVSTSRRQHQLPVWPMLIDGSLVHPVCTVRNLEVFINADLVMRSHVTRVVAQCFAVLRQLRLIRRLLLPSTLKTVVVMLVLSRLYYANSVLTGLPAYFVKRLQSVLNASARLIYVIRRFDHVSDALMSLHWLRIPERTQFKLAVLVHRVLHGNAPECLGCPTFRVDHHCELHHPIVFSSRQFVVRLLMHGRLRYLGQLYAQFAV